MILGVHALPVCLDVEQHRHLCPREVLSMHLQAYDSLLQHTVRTDAAGFRTADPKAVVPALAERYEVSRDGRTYNFSLRRGVFSASGNELTAHDVKWSWERAFALNSWSARASRSGGVSSPDAVRVMQNHNLEIHLDEPQPNLPLLLAGAFPAIYDLQTVRERCPVGDPWGNQWLRANSAGFGPYSLETVVPGEEAVLTANESYWRGVPRVRRLIVRAVGPGRSRAEALRRGTVDVIENLSCAEAEQVKDCTSIRLTELSRSRELLLQMDRALPPFDQPQVCQALERALPYDEMATLLSSAAKASPDGQDQRLARGLLREAGYGAGFRVSLFVPEGFADLEAMASLIQRACMRLDLKVMVEKLPINTFADRKARRHLPLYVEERTPAAWSAGGNEQDTQPGLKSLLLGRAPVGTAARAGIEGLVRRPDGCPRYFELRKG